MAEEIITTPEQGGAEGVTPEAKTYTQEQVEKMIEKRVARVLKGIPSDEEMKAYHDWKESQQSEAERFNNVTKERDDLKTQLGSAQAKLEAAERTNYLLSKGLTGDEAEFIAFKAAKAVNETTTFEQAVDELIKNKKASTFDWSAPVSGSKPATNPNAAMNDMIRGAFK